MRRGILVLCPYAIPSAPPTDDPSAEMAAWRDVVRRWSREVIISDKMPIRVPGVSVRKTAASAHQCQAPDEHVALEVAFEDEAAERRCLAGNAGAIVGLFSNPAIESRAVVCPADPVGDLDDVSRQMRFDSLLDAGYDGRGVRIAVADTGLNRRAVPVGGGFEHPGFPAPGSSASAHGAMMAFDARLAAPAATILDYPLVRGPNQGSVAGLLFDALTVYSALLADFQREPTPLIVLNGWGIGNRTDDPPPGTAGHYSSNPDHVFNVAVATLVAAGADVLFAAGNCGGPCGFPDCAPAHIGAGNGILGANSHPDVITVGAVTVDDDLLGYSSQGPGRIASQKPDVVASSHFSGSHIAAMPADSGTSAACAVAGGIVAALRSMPAARRRTPRTLKVALLASARQPDGVRSGWNAQTGHGILEAKAAAVLLSTSALED